MERASVIQQLLDHANLDLLDSAGSVIKTVQARLETGFQYKDINTYCKELVLLKDLIACSQQKPQFDSNKTLIQMTSDVVKTCFRLLYNICPTVDGREEIVVLLGSVCQLVARCVLIHTNILVSVLESIKGSIESFIQKNINDNDGASNMDIHATLELLRQVLCKIGGNEHIALEINATILLRDIFHRLKIAIEFVSSDLTGTHCVIVILKLLEMDSENIQQYLQELWQCIQTYSMEGQEDTKPYILLCGLANWFFPVTGLCQGHSEVVQDGQLWATLQQGLLSRHSITRKRSMYLVKRIVDTCEKTDVDISTQSQFPIFWWTKKRKVELSKTWEDFMLLVEVLEEKQVHVIKPLLTRMTSLIQAAELNSNGDLPLLHTSWLTTILLRCANHESLRINCWSAETALSIDLNICPLLQQGQQKYLTGQLLQSLAETKLFNREPGSPSGIMPALGDKLVTFFQSCHKTLPDNQRGPFFCETVQSVCNARWAFIPLLYICRGLALVPSSPCLDRDTVLSIRQLLTRDLVTAETYLRGAISGFITEIVIHLTDKSQVSIEDSMQILVQIHQEDCLQRDTTLWQQCVQWLKDVPEDNADWTGEGITKYLENCVSKYLEVSIDSKFTSADAVTAHSIARLLLLALDASITTKVASGDTDLLGSVLGKLEMIINSINTHSYMSTHKADKAAQLLVLIVKELCPKYCDPVGHVAKAVLSALTNCQHEMMVYMCGQITEANITLFDRSVLTLYQECVEMLIGLRDVVKTINFEKLTGTCVAILNRTKEMQISLHTRMQQLFAMCILGNIADFLSHDLKHGKSCQGNQVLHQAIIGFLNKWEVLIHFQRPSSESNVSQQEWGRVASLFLQHQWHVVLLGIQCSADPWCPVQELLALAKDTLSVGLEETSVSAMKCIAVLVQQAVSTGAVSDDELVVIINTCWSSMQESRRSPKMWSVLGEFVHVAYQDCLLIKDEDSPVIQRLIQCAHDLLAYGSEKTGVVSILVDQLASVWTKPELTQHAIKFAGIIADLCKFGGQPTRGQRQLYDVSATVKALGDQCAVNSLKKPIANWDLLVRTTVIDFLCILNPDNDTHCHLVTELIKLCSTSYTTVLQGSSNRFANSLVHRQRHRLIQTVLLLNSFVTEDYIPELWKFLWTSLEQECQPSIRHVLEWIVMAITARHIHYGKEIWSLFEKYRDSKNVVLCSLLCIAIHMGPNLPPDQQEEYYHQAFTNILPWCMAHHFQTRTFAQASLCRMWAQCQELRLHGILEANSILKCLVHFNQENRNSTVNVKKLLDSFYFKNLNFKNDFTLEVIFNILPTMTDLTEEDWIRPDMFVLVNPGWLQDQRSPFIKLCNAKDPQLQSELGQWKYSALKIIEDGEGVDITAGDVQKKIMPWKQMMPDLETQDEIDHGIKDKDKQGLVVVTSLISKVPNLGGLCRTSEIFGVSEYVLGNLKYTEDKAFQSLSVTAHKWLPITEVNEHKLPDYLQQKRQEGYTLVGVEQTANSRCLTDFTFPVKTLLLLGNEKEGIPVDLISLLDVCVEIPQQGVVRSLNVHVSGALLIWEYRRQQLVKVQ